MVNKAVGVGLTLFFGINGSVFGQVSFEVTEVAESNTSIQAVPQFYAEGSWAKLPNQWVMAIVSSTWVDDEGHLWVLQRPNTLSDEERPRRCGKQNIGFPRHVRISPARGEGAAEPSGGSA